ncbi:unnamed protein product [Mycena citricolor]|uniref:Uncharacterized protein n=1 Tax=Mycena citricolor TaxID=2018698 RepID=A0AAD2HFC9_9AGAR|nr:unnamed protein product [Mycena citricolor]
MSSLSSTMNARPINDEHAYEVDQWSQARGSKPVSVMKSRSARTPSTRTISHHDIDHVLYGQPYPVELQPLSRPFLGCLRDDDHHFKESFGTS